MRDRDPSVKPLPPEFTTFTLLAVALLLAALAASLASNITPECRIHPPPVPAGADVAPIYTGGV